MVEGKERGQLPGRVPTGVQLEEAPWHGVRTTVASLAIKYLVLITDNSRLHLHINDRVY